MTDYTSVVSIHYPNNLIFKGNQTINLLDYGTLSTYQSDNDRKTLSLLRTMLSAALSSDYTNFNLSASMVDIYHTVQNSGTSSISCNIQIRDNNNNSSYSTTRTIAAGNAVSSGGTSGCALTDLILQVSGINTNCTVNINMLSFSFTFKLTLPTAGDPIRRSDMETIFLLHPPTSINDKRLAAITTGATINGNNHNYFYDIMTDTFNPVITRPTPSAGTQIDISWLNTNVINTIIPNSQYYKSSW